MIGRRLPVVDDDGHRRMTMPERPGDYCGPLRGYTGDLEACFFLKPNARDPGVPASARSVQHVTFPPHTYRECADGSLEIRNSLGSTKRTPTGVPEIDADDGWHGYLDEGHVWRKA
jgi:hypothetical protein